jgi:hypothetical protein
MNKRQLLEIQMSRKKYDVIPTAEMAKRVSDLEKVLSEKMDIWDDEDTYNKYQQINKLNLSDRRLLLVFSLLDGSIARTATYFQVNRKTILNNIERIKENLDYDLH